MSWGEIKHAVNSTLGTTEFTSLDKMINGTKGLVASENLYASVLEVRTQIGTIANGASIWLPYILALRDKVFIIN